MTRAKTPARVAVGAPPKTARKLGRAQLEALRFAAESAYVYSLDPQTPKDLAARPEFKGVSEVAIGNWARDGRWRDKRKDFLRGLRGKMEAHISEGMVQQSLKQLQLYDQIHSNLAAFLLPNNDGQLRCQPRSLESGIAALINLDKARIQARREVSEALGDRVENKAGAAASRPFDMTPEQSRKLAHAVMAAELEMEEKGEKDAP